MLTDAELIELGKKALAAKEKEKERTRMTSRAVKKLITAHRKEYEGYLEGH